MTGGPSDLVLKRETMWPKTALLGGTSDGLGHGRYTNNAVDTAPGSGGSGSLADVRSALSANARLMTSALHSMRSWDRELWGDVVEAAAQHVEELRTPKAEPKAEGIPTPDHAEVIIITGRSYRLKPKTGEDRPAQEKTGKAKA